MAKQRYVRTSFWTDNYIENLSPREKLVFLYLLTNESTNLCWVYEISIKRICFETWINENDVKTILDKFKNDNKIYYIEWYICIANYTKHQVKNPSILEWIKREVLELPKFLTDILQPATDCIQTGDSLGTAGLTLLNLTLPNLTKPNSTDQEQDVPESKWEILNFLDFWDLYNKKVWNKDKAEKIWKSLKFDDQKKIMKTLPFWLKNIKDKQFQPYPTSYLNWKRWNDILKYSAPPKKDPPPVIIEEAKPLTEEERQRALERLNKVRWELHKQFT